MRETMPIVRVLSTLWKMLSGRQRFAFSGLIGALMISGLLEMTGMLFIFGFVQGLTVNAQTGERAGRLIKLTNHFIHRSYSNVEYVMYFGGGLILVLLFRNALGTLANFALARFMMKLNQRVSVNLFRGYLLSPYEKLNTEGAKKVSTVIKKIFDEFSSSFSSTAQVLSDGLTVTMVVILLLFVDPVLTITAFALFGGGGFLSYTRMQTTLRSLGAMEQKAAKESERFLRDGLEGVIDTRLRDARPRMVGGYTAALNSVALYRRRAQAMGRFPRTVNEMALAFFLVGSVARVTIAGQEVADALPTLGVFGFAGLKMSGFLNRINKALQNLRIRDESFAEHAAQLRELAPALIRGAAANTDGQYLAEERDLEEGDDGKLHRCITFDKVTYRYPGANVGAIRDLSLQIKKGEFVGICGTSGGGKSTLALLLLGLLKPNAGEVRCDDWPLFHHIRAWHRNVGYVGQDMYISRATIRQNVAFGLSPQDVDDERVNEALRMASATDFVNELSEGTKTKLRGGGRNLSGGQRQRIVIARALYLNPDVIIFDEATASLDNVTEREISDAIAGLSGEKTVICIAHRLSTLRNCDTIHVIDKGQVVASGSYDELLRTSEPFKKLALASERGPDSSPHPLVNDDD